MKPVRNFFSYALTLALLLAVGAGAIWLLSRSEPAGPLTAQDAEATPAAATATLTATLEATATVTPSQTLPDELPDEQIEPTWTPVIDEPLLTLPPPPPTPTPTAINPNETMIAAVDAFAGGLAISPDDQTLALWIEVESVPEGVSSNRQIAILDVPSRKIQKLNAYGVDLTWSPEGKRILYQVRHGYKEVELRVVDRNGENDKHLIQAPRQDIFYYSWLTPAAIGVTGLDRTYQVDLAGRTIDSKRLNLPAHLKSQAETHSTRGRLDDKVIMIDPQEKKLLINQENGQPVEITDPAGRRISDFQLSNSQDRIAYIVNEGPNKEIWLNNLAGTTPRQLYRIEFGKIVKMIWTPDDRTLLISWAETGTNSDAFLLWIDVETGEQTPVGVHGVSQSLVINHRGDRLFYGRLFENSDGSYRTEFYQLEVKQ